MTTVYVSCAESREINVFSLATSGEFQLVQRIPVDGAVQPLRISPDNQLLYAGSRGENAIHTYAIDPASGKLNPAGKISVLGSPTYLCCDRARRVLIAAYYHDNALVTYPLDANGIPQSPCQTETALPRAHSAVLDASSRWLLVATLGADALRCYQLGDDLRLTPAAPATIPVCAGSGPRHLAFAPDNRHLYCINELDGSIDRFDFDASNGQTQLRESTSLLPPGFAGAPWAAELRLVPDGRFLYASERRSSTLATFAVDAASGQLRLIGHCPTETQPRGMAIDPAGKWLIAAGQISGHVSVYELDGQTGLPQLRQRHATGLGPIGIEILRMS